MNCVINLNKPKGISSHKAVREVIKALGLSKAGHAGTLDPLATGTLLICTGKATKLSNYLTSLDKEYVVTMKLGVATDTLDAEGKVVKEKDSSFVTIALVQDTVKEFVGPILQTPPMYSALKHNGTPLYKLARKNITLERQKREITIYCIELTNFSLPLLTFRVVCSKGTYIRSLCADIAEKLGTCAHVVSLNRTRIGNFSLNNSLCFSDLSTGLKNTRAGCHSMDDTLVHFPEIRFDDEQTKKILNGQTLINKRDKEKEGLVRIKDSEGELLGVGKINNNHVKMTTLLVNQEQYLK